MHNVCRNHLIIWQQCSNHTLSFYVSGELISRIGCHVVERYQPWKEWSNSTLPSHKYNWIYKQLDRITNPLPSLMQLLKVKQTLMLRYHQHTLFSEDKSILSKVSFDFYFKLIVLIRDCLEANCLSTFCEFYGTFILSSSLLCFKLFFKHFAMFEMGEPLRSDSMTFHSLQDQVSKWMSEPFCAYHIRLGLQHNNKCFLPVTHVRNGS